MHVQYFLYKVLYAVVLILYARSWKIQATKIVFITEK